MLRLLRRLTLWLPLLLLLWLLATILEWRVHIRLVPVSSYQFCGDHSIGQLPTTVQIGFYEEFPTPWRLAKLTQLDFPVKLAIAAKSRAEFLALRADILKTYPQVREVYFWPVLTESEGYYVGSWSDPDAIERAAHEAAGLPVLWDLEMPRNRIDLPFANLQRNRSFLDSWFKQRTDPVHIWRSNTSMGLDPLFLRLVGMHYEPTEYPAVYLHLDLYMTGAGLPADEFRKIVRCGVERYGDRFIPSLGVLNDGEGDASYFISLELLRRNLQIVRESGVQEIWLFGSNGLNEEVITMLHDTLPLPTLNAAK